MSGEVLAFQGLKTLATNVRPTGEKSERCQVALFRCEREVDVAIASGEPMVTRRKQLTQRHRGTEKRTEGKVQNSAICRPSAIEKSRWYNP